MPRKVLAPDEPGDESHHLLKRQESSCFVCSKTEPPSSLQYNPHENRTLTLRCNVLLGSISLEGCDVFSIVWFFSLDGIVGDQVQLSHFQVKASFSAFESVLEVSAHFRKGGLLKVFIYD
jgi:hypothetical protein